MKTQRKTILVGTIIMGCGTLLSRILGMLRDAATASMLGMSAGGVMDSFVLAFRLPDVTRRMFGEGSISVALVPIFAKLWNEDRKKAWALVSAALVGVFLLLTLFVIFGEIICWIVICNFASESKVHIAASLTMLMLPYMILICMAAIAAATLQTLNSFVIPSMIPTILNITWLLGILVVAPKITDEPLQRCYLLSICILVAGFIQLGIQLPFMYRAGFRFGFNFQLVRDEIREISASFFPSMIGLMTLQLNILVASIIAWAFSGNREEAIWWLGRIAFFPMETGSAASIYFSERLYEFPQGILGLTVATVIYPTLSRHASKLNFDAVADNLSFGLRTIFALSIPSGVGLMFLSDNLSHLLYQRGAFTPADMFRTGDMIYWFSFGVAGFCSVPLLVRAFYVLGNVRTPLLVGLLCSVVNLSLGLLLIWPFQERGLAVAASFAATFQAVLLLICFSRLYKLLDYKALLITIGRSCAASFVMGCAVISIMQSIVGESSLYDMVRITLSVVIGCFVYSVVYFILGGREINRLIAKKNNKAKPAKSGKRRRK